MRNLNKCLLSLIALSLFIPVSIQATGLTRALKLNQQQTKLVKHGAVFGLLGFACGYFVPWAEKMNREHLEKHGVAACASQYDPAGPALAYKVGLAMAGNCFALAGLNKLGYKPKINRKELLFLLGSGFAASMISSAYEKRHDARNLRNPAQKGTILEKINKINCVSGELFLLVAMRNLYPEFFKN